MDIQLKKSGIGVKEKKSKNHLLYSIKQNLFAYAMLIPTFVCMMCIHLFPCFRNIYVFAGSYQLTMTKFLNAPFIGLKNYYEILLMKRV